MRWQLTNFLIYPVYDIISAIIISIDKYSKRFKKQGVHKRHIQPALRRFLAFLFSKMC